MKTKEGIKVKRGDRVWEIGSEEKTGNKLPTLSFVGYPLPKGVANKTEIYSEYENCLIECEKQNV